MTKAKHGSFQGAWMDGRIPVELIMKRLNNEPSANKKGGGYDAAPVLRVLSRQVEIWLFDQARRDAEPEPAQWPDRLSAILVPVQPSPAELLTLKRAIRSLPKLVLAGLDLHLFRALEIGCIALLARDPFSADDANSLRDALAGVVADLARSVGKRGPKRDTATPLRAVVHALQAASAIKPPAARVLAADLLRLCDIPAPASRTHLAALLKG